MPSRRMPFSTGKRGASSALPSHSSSSKLATGTGSDRERVMMRKSENFTFSVTVRPWSDRRS